MKTFWSNEKHPEAVALLNEEVPRSGRVTDPSRPALEAWRRLSNAYHDVYNNGCGNWHIRRHDLAAACKYVGAEPMRKSDFVDCDGGLSRFSHWEFRLEAIADRVFMAALAEALVSRQG